MSPNDAVEERSWYEDFWVSVRREDVSLRLWCLLPYSRFISPVVRRGQ